MLMIVVLMFPCIFTEIFFFLCIIFLDCEVCYGNCCNFYIIMKSFFFFFFLLLVKINLLKVLSAAAKKWGEVALAILS